ncbi:hypothetical protein AM588_10004549 [Phytophthora nicotianae]|uniref:Jacalin-type lectin domain-containing protein n=1 Tax=Phytophthora nicotianae TaxID=4792 RepID=A0A0W8D6B4_PHYNI|nr:hypothetical protein AM588_10004549 [Phytophthora nicotianae]
MKFGALLSVAIVSLATAQKLEVDKATSLNETQEQQQQASATGDASASLLDSTSDSHDLSASTSASGSWDDVFVGDSDSASASAPDESGSSSEASVESSSASDSSDPQNSGDSSGSELSGSDEIDQSSLFGSMSDSGVASADTGASESYDGSSAESEAASGSTDTEESSSSSDTAAASMSDDASGSGSSKMDLSSLLGSASGSQKEDTSNAASGSSVDVFGSDSEASASTSTASSSTASSDDTSTSEASGSNEVDQDDSNLESQEASAATSTSESSDDSEAESDAASQESAASEDKGSASTSSSSPSSGSASSVSDQNSLVDSTSGSQDTSTLTSSSGSSTDVNVGDSTPVPTAAPTPAPTPAPTQAPAPTTPPISVEDSVQLSESFGGPHGNEFSDKAGATSGQTVASLTIRAGERVDGVILDITAPVAMTFNHGGGGGNPNTLTLGPGEYITSMEAHWGEKKGHTRIFYLRFETSAGNSVAGGSWTDNRATVKAPEGFQLGGFFGRDGDEIDLLGAIWTSIVPITPAPGAPTPAPTPWVEKFIDHDAVVPFKQPEPVTISEKAAIKFKPQLHITNGCHAYPAVNAIGETSGGLKTSGAPSAGCKGSGWGSQVYGRSTWYNGVWAIMYSWYFPKDSPSTGLGHRHDWEHVIVWIDNPEIAEPKILAVTPSAHSGYSAQVPPDANKVDGTSVKVKYLSKWPINHALESTGEGGDYQDLIMWGQMTDAAREALSRTSFGDANVPMNDGNFEPKLGKAWPFK